MDEIRRNMDNGLLTGKVFIDLKKVFDTIDHCILLNKPTEIRRMCMTGLFSGFPSSYLQGRSIPFLESG